MRPAAVTHTGLRRAIVTRPVDVGSADGIDPTDPRVRAIGNARGAPNVDRVTGREGTTRLTTKLADDMARAADHARRRAAAFPGSVTGDELPWAVVEAFDAGIRGHVERDRRIEEERDRVLIAAVGLAETRPEDGPEAIEAARTRLAGAIDYLEQAVLRFGIVNGRGAQRGLGEPGQRVTART